jgi:hypothetical protein
MVVQIVLGRHPSMTLSIENPRTRRRRAVRRIHPADELAAFDRRVLEVCMQAINHFNRHANAGVRRAFHAALEGGADVCIDVRLDVLAPELRCFVRGRGGREVEVFSVRVEDESSRLH